VFVELHPTSEVLAAFARGDLNAAELATVAEHVERCDACCAALQRVPDDSLVGLARQAGESTTNPIGGASPAFFTDPTAVPSELADHPRYRILDQLGAGGMGVVYKAEHRMMGRVVALKVLAPHLTARSDAVERFRREVKAAAQLAHANIVTAHDADEAGGLHFLVMEYVDGISLDRLIARKGPLPVPMACHFARQAALGLQHAAEKGMIHRDIKPQNLVVTRKGQLKILDFGLARFARGAEAESGAAAPGQPLAPITAASLLMGTPEFLSPEQARSSRGLDIRSDLYSLGGTLYYLLTGSVPFPHATTLIDKLLAHTGEEPTPLQALRPDVPDALVAVVSRLMAKDRAARFQTPAEAVAALTPFARGEAAGPPTPVPGALPPAVPVPPAATTVPNAGAVFAFDTEPDVDRPNTPAQVPESRRRTKPAGSRKWKWTALPAVVVLGLLGGDLARQVFKKPTGDTAAPAGQAGKPETPGKANAGAPRVVPPADPGKANVPLKVLIVVPHNRGLWMPDYTPVKRRLEANKVTVVTASHRSGTAEGIGMGGVPAGAVPIDEVLSPELDVAPFAAIVFVGRDAKQFATGPKEAGPGAAGAKAAIDKMMAAGKPVAALCYGQAALAGNGYLKGKAAAGNAEIVKYYPDDANWQSDRVVTAGKFLTGADSTCAEEFTDALLALIRGG
jgi:serine/threonine-protein kinase